MVLRPKRLLKALWLPHLYAALLVVAAVWLLAWGVSQNEVSGQLRFSAASLQLIGLIGVIQGLWTRGSVFGKPNPIEGFRRFLARLRAAFRPPTGIELRGRSRGGGTASVSVSATGGGRKPPRTLEDRVDRLEADLTAIRAQMRQDKEGLEDKIRGAVAESRSGHRTVIKRMEGIRGELELTLAGNYAWEWVAVFWLLVGLLQRVAAEAIT